MRLLAWSGIALALACLFGCSRPPKTPSARQPATSAPPQQGILATVGDQTITLNEFQRRYRDAGRGQPPARFLQQLIEEKLLLLEARQQQMGRSEHVVNATRRAMAQAALKLSFSKWFQPGDLSIFKVRKYYLQHKRRFVRPRLMFAWHILARFPLMRREPKVFEPKAKARQEKMLNEARALAKEIGKEALALVLKANPSTPEAFAAAAQPLLKKYNTPEPRLIAWADARIQQLMKRPPRHGVALGKFLGRVAPELRRFVACMPCYSVLYYVRKMRLKWRAKRSIAPHQLQQFVRAFKKHARLPRERIRIRNLSARGPFSHGDMVKSFADDLFALKDGDYSKALTRTKFGYHIMFRVRSIPPLNVSLAEATPVIRKELYTQQRTRMFRDWLKLQYKKRKPVRYLGRLK